VPAAILSRLGRQVTVAPQLPTLWRLADTFNTTIDYLAGRTDVVTAESALSIDKRARELLRLYEILPPTSRGELLKYAAFLAEKQEKAA
jgi:transcriptional regulator with XRE-family HTH domain